MAAKWLADGKLEGMRMWKRGVLEVCVRNSDAERNVALSMKENWLHLCAPGYRYLEFMLFAGLHFANSCVYPRISNFIVITVGITILSQFYCGSGEKVNLIKLFEYRFVIGKKNWRRIHWINGSQSVKKRSIRNTFSIILEIDLEFVWCEIRVYW